MRIIFIILLLATLAFGFGKNKVQYQYMEWEYLPAPHFTLYYHQDQGALPDASFLWLSDIYRDLAFRFDFTHGQNVPVILYESPALFEQTNIITEILPEEVGGFTELFKNRVAIPFNGSLPDLRHVLHHEMAHAFVFGVMYDGNIFRAMSSQTPLWFNEGLAEALSSGWNREADMFMLDRVLNSSVPPPGPMLDGYLAYKGGQSFLYYLYSTGGDSLFNAMLREFKYARSAESAIERAYKQSLADLGRDWLSELRRIYWPEIGRRSEPRRHAKPVTVHTKDRSRFNVRPRVSPDGKSVAFFSDKNDYARIIITDAKGRELRQIGQHSLSGSFESFQPFNGGIAWSPDSRELAFIAKKGGRNEIRVVNAKNGRTREAARLPLSAINGLDWSKDGKKLVLTAISHGRTDLYLYDFETFKLNLLTDSHESKGSPRFSPDGKKIIFAVTDTAGLGTGPLPAPPAPPVTDPPPKTPPSKKTKTSSKAPPAKTQPSPPPKATAPPPAPSTATPDTSPTPVLNPRPTSNIAILDIDENIWSLLTDTKWNDKQPAFSPDGKSFVFVSDRNGVDNLYIASIDDPGNPRPLTDYAGSCGNPDWAADGSAIVYDNFMNQAWNVWRMEKPLDKIISDSALAPTRWAEHEEDPSIPFFIKRSFADTNGVDDSINTASGGKDSANIVNAGNVNDSTAAANAGDTAKSEKGRGKPKNSDRKNRDDDYQYSYRDSFDDPSYPYERRRRGRDERAGADALITVDTMPGPQPYTLRFSPDLVIVGLGVSTYSGASGQALVSFSDVMGDHRVTVVGDLQAEFNDYAQVYAAYEYMKLRFNVTVGGFYYKYYSFAYDGLSGRYFHDLETGGFLGLSYPFSMFSRADLQILNRYMERTPLTGGDPAALEYNALLAVTGYSFDNILWGITGPLRGVRASAQLQLAPPLSFTSEAYLSGNIDVRHYTHLMKRFVWANRLTAGATIGLDDNPAARRFFLGGDANWFNYGVNMENYYNNLAYSYYSDIVAPLRGWNYFDITGDRMLLMNSEFRFPFIREISTVWPIPMQIRYINGAMFIDAGYAWTRDDQEGKLLPLPPKIVGGYGFGMRANLGIFVLRYDRGWPTDWKSTGGPINYFSLGAEF